MLFIEINGEKYPCEIQSFTTQTGKDAIRIISSEAPLAKEGFRIVDDEDNLIANRSDYIYLYREDGDCKEYTAEPEQMIFAQGYYYGDQPDSPYTVLSRRISTVSSQVNAITPYEESKIAYIDDTQVVFENVVKEGILTVSMIDKNGTSIKFDVAKEDGNIIVSFEPLEEVATVSIAIQ